jgi:hypothetical protein
MQKEYKKILKKLLTPKLFMIKVNKTDSIIDIIQKIQKEKSNDIIIDFPF